MSAIVSFYSSCGENNHHVEVVCTLAGNDACLCVAGGQAAHIGAAALAIPRESLRGDGSRAASASVICVTGHKDDELAREIALNFATKHGCAATVTVGLHIDDATEQDIRLLIQNTKMALEDIDIQLANSPRTC